MKLVTQMIIKPFKLEDVREALSSIGIQGLTVTESERFRASERGMPSCTGGGIQRQLPAKSKN